MNLQNVLDLAKERTGSDYKTAQRLNVTTAAIAQWRNRPGSGPDDENVIKLAELTELPLEVVATATYEKRTRNPVMRQMWADLLRKLEATAGTAACALLAAGMIAAPDVVNAAPHSAPNADRNAVYYVKSFCRAIRRMMGAVTALQFRTLPSFP